MRNYKITIIILFLVILIIPVLFININQNQLSEIDNSKLPEWDDISDIDSLDNYISKRIGFRNNAINIYTEINDIVFNKMIHPTYDYGKDDYVFFKIDSELIDTNYLDSYVKLVKKMQDYVTSRGSYFLYVLNPSKKAVQKEYLPNGYNYNENVVKYLIKKFDELEINYIDNTELLKEKAAIVPTFNKQFDAGHWNDYGAFYGIKSIFDKLNNDNVLNENISLEEYEIEYEHKDSLLVSEFEINEDVPVFNLKNNEYKEYDIKDKIYVDKQFKNVLKTSNSNEKTDLLIFRGSYIIDRQKFISNKFNNVYYIHNYENAINYDYYYNLANKPKTVIFEGVDYAISEVYYNKFEMDRKSNNVLYNKIDDKNKKVYDLYDVNINIDVNENYITYSLINGKVNNAYLLVDKNIYDFSKIGNEYKITLEKELVKDKKIKIIIDEKNSSVFRFLDKKDIYK